MTLERSRYIRFLRLLFWHLCYLRVPRIPVPIVCVNTLLVTTSFRICDVNLLYGSLGLHRTFVIVHIVYHPNHEVSWRTPSTMHTWKRHGPWRSFTTSLFLHDLWRRQDTRTRNTPPLILLGSRVRHITHGTAFTWGSWSVVLVSIL